MQNNRQNRSPLVGVTPSVDAHTDGARFRLNAAYIGALEGAGLTPLIIQPMADPSRADEMLGLISGLVLTGGDDIDPRLYGEDRHPATEEPSALRDAWEIALSSAARARGTPTLAICRGMQLVNVELGGTLIQDIAAQHAGALVHERSAARSTRVHAVEIAPGSRLGAATGASRIQVNSMHHQAVGDVPRQLRVTATSSDGIIEAFEWPTDDWWMLAVQWHPEELAADVEPWDRRLFAAFADVLRQR